MLIAVAAASADAQSEVDPRFGRTKYFFLTDSEVDDYEIIDNEQNLNSPRGAGIQAKDHHQGKNHA